MSLKKTEAMGQQELVWMTAVLESILLSVEES